MHGRSCWCLLVISLLTLPPALLRGQSDRANSASTLAFTPSRVIQPSAVESAPRPPLRPPIPPGGIGLPEMARAAGKIFSGTVTAIARHPATHGQAMETVAITFHVEKAFRGVTPGEDFTISQWIGLWFAGQRYRAGERVLLFLYPPSKLGLTSCVAASMGRFRIDPADHVLLSAQHLSAFRADPVLGGKARVSFNDFAKAVRQAGGEE